MVITSHTTLGALTFHCKINSAALYVHVFSTFYTSKICLIMVTQCGQNIQQYNTQKYGKLGCLVQTAYSFINVCNHTHDMDLANEKRMLKWPSASQKWSSHDRH